MLMERDWKQSGGMKSWGRADGRNTGEVLIFRRTIPLETAVGRKDGHRCRLICRGKPRRWMEFDHLLRVRAGKSG